MGSGNLQDSENSPKVVIRTNSLSTDITIDANLDTVVLYGNAGNVTVENIADESLHINGNVSYVEIKAGHMVVENGAYVGAVYKSSATATVETKGTGSVGHAHASSQDTTANNDNSSNAYNVVFDYDGVDMTAQGGKDHTSGQTTVEALKSEANSSVAKELGYEITISNANETVYSTLKDLAVEVNGGNTFENYTVKLLNDIDLSSFGKWAPIGTESKPFKGSFDGNKKTISNLTIDSSSTDLGFFGYVSGNNVSYKDVTFENFQINQGEGSYTSVANVGFLIGNVDVNCNGITIKGITIDSNSSLYAYRHAGGLIGKLYAYGNINFEECTNNGKVAAGSGSGYTGGLVGIQSNETGNTKTITVKDCHNTGAISSQCSGNAVAGLFGRINDKDASTETVLFENCSNSGKIESIATSDGLATSVGLAFVNTCKSITIKNCSNSGQVTSSIGSAVGIASVGTATDGLTFEGEITNSGDISGIASASGIGLASNTILNNATIVNSGNVSATNDGSKTSGNYVGGLASSFEGSITIVGTSRFENTGNISVNTVWGETYAGGVFGKYSNASNTAIDFNLTVNVHDCTISGVGAGRWFHNTGTGGDAMKNDPVAVGGFAGRINSLNVTYLYITVDKVTLSATASETTKEYSPNADPEVREKFMAGSFAGIMSIGVNDSVSVDNKLTNATLTNNSFTANDNYKGIIVGCSYNSYSTTARTILTCSGTFMPATGGLNYCGNSVNNATIQQALAE